jgi:hypothetical protein
MLSDIAIVVQTKMFKEMGRKVVDWIELIHWPALLDALTIFRLRKRQGIS